MKRFFKADSPVNVSPYLMFNNDIVWGFSFYEGSWGYRTLGISVEAFHLQFPGIILTPDLDRSCKDSYDLMEKIRASMGGWFGKSIVNRLEFLDGNDPVWDEVFCGWEPDSTSDDQQIFMNWNCILDELGFPE